MKVKEKANQIDLVREIILGNEVRKTHDELDAHKEATLRQIELLEDRLADLEHKFNLLGRRVTKNTELRNGVKRLFSK